MQSLYNKIKRKVLWKTKETEGVIEQILIFEEKKKASKSKITLNQ